MPAKIKEPPSRLRLVHDSEGRGRLVHDSEGRGPFADGREGVDAAALADGPLALVEGAPESTAAASGVTRALLLDAASEASCPPSGKADPREDADLVALCLAGQSSAFEALYRRHSAYAMALGVRVQGNPTDVEDIVHDAFLRAHDRLESLRDGSAFRPWLASMVVSLVRSRLRKRRMLTALGLSTSDPIDLDSLVSRDAGPEVRARIAQVYGVLSQVPVDHGICWTLRFIEGRKLEDVAQMAQCSLATAKRRIAAVQQKVLVLDALTGHDGRLIRGDGAEQQEGVPGPEGGAASSGVRTSSGVLVRPRDGLDATGGGVND